VKASQGRVSGVSVPLTGCNDPNTRQRWMVNKVSHPPVKPPLMPFKLPKEPIHAG